MPAVPTAFTNHINRTLHGVMRLQLLTDANREARDGDGAHAGDEMIETEQLHAPLDAGTGSKVQDPIGGTFGLGAVPALTRAFDSKVMASKSTFRARYSLVT